jgi:hypothetical protein
MPCKAAVPAFAGSEIGYVVCTGLRVPSDNCGLPTP